LLVIAEPYPAAVNPATGLTFNSSIRLIERA
jgi:hypothetical protein